MSDPRIVKQTGNLVVKVKMKETNEILDLYKPIDDSYKGISPELVEEITKSEIEKITDKPNTTLYKLITSYSYAEKDVLKDFDFGNILIEAYLPYCFLIPNFTELLIHIPESNVDALVITQKIWTNRAKAEDIKSDEVDYYAEEKPLYLKGTNIRGPRMPFEEELGWEHFVTGRNIEKIKDRNGIFRYTKVYIQFNLNLPPQIANLSSTLQENLFKDIKDKSLLVINRLVDNYREITNEAHIRRLGRININSIYFIDQDLGYYMSDLDLTVAMINRSGKEIKELESRLNRGVRPELYKLLLLNSNSSFDAKDYTLAIVESFQALEIFLENFLITEFKKRGDKESDFIKIIEKYWRTKQRLNHVLKMLKGVSLNNQTDIWDKWCLHYDKTRNEVIHVGKEPSESETKETLEINENVISWLLSL